MMFTINNRAGNRLFMAGRVFFDAKTVILRHRITPGEQKLNQYLIKSYKADLKTVCLYLLNKAKIQRDKDNNMIVLFPDSDDDKLAALITYGNLEIPGSNILKQAFFRD